MRGEGLKGHLDLLLLATLKVAPAHGYAIIDHLWDLSDETFDLSEGTIYPALHRLERAGLITSTWDSESGRRRRLYELTAEGKKAVKTQSKDWSSFHHGMDSVL